MSTDIGGLLAENNFRVTPGDTSKYLPPRYRNGQGQRQQVAEESSGSLDDVIRMRMRKLQGAKQQIQEQAPVKRGINTNTRRRIKDILRRGG